MCLLFLNNINFTKNIKNVRNERYINNIKRYYLSDSNNSILCIDLGN